MHGKGTYYYHNKRNHIYTGEFKNNKPNGKGRIHIQETNQTVFEGHFLDNRKDGFGEYIMDNGERYLGEWKKNSKNGVGEYFFMNGNIWQGKWFNDEPTKDCGVWTIKEAQDREKVVNAGFNKDGVPL